jgi:hypothetical protein
VCVCVCVCALYIDTVGCCECREGLSMSVEVE